LVEGFRPGVTERLGLGPEACLARRPSLVYGRMTGWGQDGPLAHAAGRDVNYVALSGTLAMIGRQGSPPVPPLTLVGDFGGGGMLLAFGILCGVLEARASGRGQVVDAAMVDGAALLAGMFHGLRADGGWGERGTNLLDGGAWFYDVYETADGRFVSVGAIDQRACAELLQRTGLADDVDGGGPVPDQADRSAWPAMRDRLAAVFRTRTRDEWCAVLEGTDACVAPLLDPGEAHEHPHLRERGTFVEVGGVIQPAAAPRFSRTAPTVAGPPPAPGAHTDEALLDWGFTAAEVADLRSMGALG
jgi:alpha-methylacyl-CoA racemase